MVTGREERTLANVVPRKPPFKRGKWTSGERRRHERNRARRKLPNPFTAKFDIFSREDHRWLDPSLAIWADRLGGGWAAQLDVFGQRCAYCLATGVGLTLDHVGPHSISLLDFVPACRACNSSKCNRGVLWLVNGRRRR